MSADPISATAASEPHARHTSSAADLRQLIAAQRAGHPFLTLREPEGRLVLHTLPPVRARCTIGRSPLADIHIQWDPEVSGLHCELERLGGQWTIVDDGLSRNGTFVNGHRQRGRHRLLDRDRIRVGTTVLAYAEGSSHAVPKTASAEDKPMIALTRAQMRVAVALCGPRLSGNTSSVPASNRQIACELYLTVDAVKMHLRALFSKFGLDGVPQNQKRARLAELLTEFGFVDDCA